MALAGSTLADRIKEIRTRRVGDTQPEFAYRLRSRTNKPAAPALVSRWERGITEPSSHYLRQIAALGGVSVGELFGENGAGA
jgi:transcriptional regulator with XRE-family HTH domain